MFMEHSQNISYTPCRTLPITIPQATNSRQEASMRMGIKEGQMSAKLKEEIGGLCDFMTLPIRLDR